MGGYEGGALAAKITADTLSEGAGGEGAFGSRLDVDEDGRALRGLLTEAARRMTAEAQKDPRLAAMGATVGGVLLREKSALAFNCGDCRVYRFSAGGLERVTRDHSIVQALFEKDEIDEEEMRTHPKKNVVTSAVSANSIGVNEDFDLYVKGLSLSGGDSFFLCSDGVWEALSSSELAALISRGTPSLDAARRLFGALLAANCNDNVSFIWAGWPGRA
jgi:protein phosphatase